MAGRIRQEDVAAVRERTNLVAVISGYLQLRKAGRDSMVGVCPFHAEKTPSFSVSPAKQVYHCFGCGEGGDVFRFLQKIENLSFGEAVERLAKDAGVRLRYEGESAADRRVAGRRSALQRANAEAAGLYHGVLLEGREGGDARAYLSGRGIGRAEIERFGIGYAPGYPDFLLRRLTRTFSPEALEQAGLVARDASGTLRDRFRGRIVFPIHDLSGNAVGLGGRLLVAPGRPAPDAAKYVNSPDTDVYHKGSVLYNLHRAKAEITRTGRVFLVEGYTDVVALDRAGVGAAVATCGTALGEDHLRLLVRFTDRAVLTFDADEAGLRAAERAFQFHQRFALDLRVLVLPEGQDPADFVLAHAAPGDEAAGAGEAFLALAEVAVPLVEYMIDRAMRGRSLDTVEDRAAAVRAGLRLVASLEDPVRREEYARQVADRAGVSVASVLLEVHRLPPPMPDGEAGPVGRGGGSPWAGATSGVRPAGGAGAAGASAEPAGAEPAQGAHPARATPAQRVEREALRLVVQDPAACRARLTPEDGGRISTPTYRKVFELAMEVGPGVSAAELVALAAERGETLGKLVAALAVESLEAGGGAAPEYVRAVFLRLEEFALSRQIEEARRRLERLNPQRDPGYDDLFEELVTLEGVRRRVRQAAEAASGGV